MANIQKISERGRITLPEGMWKGKGKELNVSVSQISEDTVVIRKIKKEPAPSLNEENLLANCIAAEALCDRCAAALQAAIDGLQHHLGKSADQGKG